MKVLLAVILAVAVAAGGWWWFPSASLRYTLSIYVADNGFMSHGEGVIAVDFRSNGFMLLDNTPNWSIGARGEAFAVDLGTRGTLFVLLSADASRPRSTEAGRGALFRYFADSFGDLPPNHRGKLRLEAFMKNRTVVEVAPDSLPMLVRFRDLADPSSVERVDPEHLDATFGPGVALVGATVQLTDEPVTRGIGKTLPWFRTQAGYLSGQQIRDSTRPERNITPSAFVRGVKP